MSVEKLKIFLFAFVFCFIASIIIGWIYIWLVPAVKIDTFIGTGIGTGIVMGLYSIFYNNIRKIQPIIYNQMNAQNLPKFKITFWKDNGQSQN